MESRRVVLRDVHRTDCLVLPRGWIQGARFGEAAAEGTDTGCPCFTAAGD